MDYSGCDVTQSFTIEEIADWWCECANSSERKEKLTEWSGKAKAIGFAISSGFLKAEIIKQKARNMLSSGRFGGNGGASTTEFVEVAHINRNELKRWFESHTPPVRPVFLFPESRPGYVSQVVQGADFSMSVGELSDDPKWPLELGYALAAWKAVSASIQQGEKPGAELDKWLKKTYPTLTNAMRGHIKTVANWDRTSGRGKKK